MFTFPAAMLASSLVGCLTSEDSFPDQYIEATCSMTHNCAKGNFLSEWDDQAERIDDGRDEWDDSEDFIDDCDFDGDEAVKCLASMSKYASTCDEDDGEDVGDDCEDVYTDCGDSNGGRDTG